MPDAMQWEDRIVQTELGGRILNDALPAPLQRLAPGTAVRVTVEPLTPPIAPGGGTDYADEVQRELHVTRAKLSMTVRALMDVRDGCYSQNVSLSRLARIAEDGIEAAHGYPPPASAPGGAVGEEDRAWLNCELLRFLNCYKSPTPGSLADMALVQGQKEGALRYFFEAVCNRFAERSAAVRRAVEQGRQQVVALIVTANTQAIPHHSADWMNGFAAGQRAMRSAVATGLAALTASAKGGEG